MEIQSDFKNLLGLLNKYKVEYIIVGGYALAFHGVPRLTGDIDIFINSSHENAKKILDALNEFGFESLKLTPEDFEKSDMIIQLGVSPVRVDFITSITGVTWTEANSGKVPGTYGNIPVFYLGKKEYITNKKAIGRKKDLADLESLGE
jgi:hypothetical protein